MGTSYVWKSSPCPTCGHSKEEINIGKASGGWCFALHVRDPRYGGEEEVPASLEQWIKKFETGVIEDEYGEDFSKEEMLDIITNRSWDRKAPEDPRFYLENKCVLGINNLMRREIDGVFCIGHGAGTWDLCVGTFS